MTCQIGARGPDDIWHSDLYDMIVPAVQAQSASGMGPQQQLVHSSPAPLHGLIGLPPGGPGALLNASAASSARTAGYALGQPGSAGLAWPAGQPALQGPQHRSAAALSGAVPQITPLPGVPEAQHMQHAAAAHSSMPQPSTGGGLAALPAHTASLRADPWHGAPSSAGNMTGTMQLSPQPSSTQAATRQLNSGQPGLAAAAASIASSRGLASVTSQGASGPPGSACSQSKQPSMLPGVPETCVGQQSQAHTAEATLADRHHDSMQGGEQIQQAHPDVHETLGFSRRLKPSKPGEGLREVQADSAMVPQADSHDRLNGHDRKGRSRSHSGLSNGAHEQGMPRGHAAAQHECGKSEHSSEQGRPPEVPAGYS